MATARTWGWIGAGAVAAATVVGGVLVCRARKRAKTRRAEEASSPSSESIVSTSCDPDAAYRTEIYNWEIILGIREGSMTFAPGSSHVVDCPEKWPEIQARVEREFGISGDTIGAIARGDQPRSYGRRGPAGGVPART